MPFTVITLKNVPPSLRGDLTRWMQEIATGVYVGNFNTRIRELLWSRVTESVGIGEATMSFAYRNEIGYSFTTINTQREVVDFGGIPLVFQPKLMSLKTENGFSKIAKFRKAKRYQSIPKKKKDREFIVLDIETDGLDEKYHQIIEVGAIKVANDILDTYQALICYKGDLPVNISGLTGITTDLLQKEGKPLNTVLEELLEFIGHVDIIGYNIDFDFKFLNCALSKFQKPLLTNKRYDLMKYVKKEKLFLPNYKLQTVLSEYEIADKVPHRALADAKLAYQLMLKLEKFQDLLKGV